MHAIARHRPQRVVLAGVAGSYDAGLAPIKYAGDMITNPGQTIGNTLSGIGSLFGQVGSSLNNMGKDRDDTMQSLLGPSSESRRRVHPDTCY